jgi:hypothetical protein
MPIDIIALPDSRRRGTEDVVEYFFRLTDRESSRDVGVGIAGQAINPVGKPPRSKEILTKLAEAWLRLHLERAFDPFKLSSAHLPDVPTAVADHWIDHREFPPGL